MLFSKEPDVRKKYSKSLDDACVEYSILDNPVSFKLKQKYEYASKQTAQEGRTNEEKDNS
jgi:hypothetical protein